MPPCATVLSQGYAILNINGNQYNIDYRVGRQESDYQMNIYAPKWWPKGRTTSHRGELFMGSPTDKVEYRIDDTEWKPMRYTRY